MKKKTLLCQLLKQDISCYQNVPFVLSNKLSSVALVYPYLHGETSLKKKRNVVYIMVNGSNFMASHP